ncbi:MAG: malto-oligosyltrehalose synthase [Chitinispirillaceae bacterium]
MNVPNATYRLQFSKDFTFRDAERIVFYLAQLGVSHIYASPVFKAAPQSMHGYDVVDSNQINPELGTPEQFDSLLDLVHRRDMFWLQDIVPNHMAYARENPMLMDLLEKGEYSRFYTFFDANPHHSSEMLQHQLLAPFLGKFYADSLESGEIALRYDQFGLSVTYYDHRYPLKLDTYPDVFLTNFEQLEQALGNESPDLIKYIGMVELFRSFDAQGNGDQSYDQTGHAKAMLWRLYTDNEIIRFHIEGILEKFNGVAGDADSFDILDDLLSKQIFRLSFWKVASEEINYRRFFSINNLICLRQEDSEVFDYTHKLIRDYVQQGKWDGLRVDHIDGLYNPGAYLKWLRGLAGERYITVEKILSENERLPRDWPVSGTTGYDFVNLVNGIFCRKERQNDFVKLYYKFTQLHTPYTNLVTDKKRLIIGKHMAGDIDNIAHIMMKVASRDRYGRDITLYGLKRGLVEIMAHFPIYRTYVTPEHARDEDREYIGRAYDSALSESPGLIHELDFIKKFLLLKFNGKELTKEEINLVYHFIMRFQQFTGPLMAKGYEDTVLYIYNKLISLNEVGGNPAGFGYSMHEFHSFCEDRKKDWPHTMNASSTHDTKRSEDVRARINVLSELPREWRQHLKLWTRLNRGKKAKGTDGEYMPDYNDEYMIYQTLLGAYPFSQPGGESFTNRMKEYIVKAVREAKVHTAWIKPDMEYENACVEFVEALLKNGEENRFLVDFLSFQQRIARYGIWNSLSQLVIKLTAPGVPDFYQGSELWDLSLVDPDNRRSIDFTKREALLRDVVQKLENEGQNALQEFIENRIDGRIKMFLSYKTLHTRRTFSSVFENGSYEPIRVTGRYRDSVIAYMRRYDSKAVLVVAPRFLTSIISENDTPMGEIWANTALALPIGLKASEWHNQLTDQVLTGSRQLPLAQLLADFPVAILSVTLQK